MSCQERRDASHDDSDDDRRQSTQALPVEAGGHSHKKARTREPAEAGHPALSSRDASLSLTSCLFVCLGSCALGGCAGHRCGGASPRRRRGSVPTARRARGTPRSSARSRPSCCSSPGGPRCPPTAAAAAAASSGWCCCCSAAAAGAAAAGAAGAGAAGAAAAGGGGGAAGAAGIICATSWPRCGSPAHLLTPGAPTAPHSGANPLSPPRTRPRPRLPRRPRSGLASKPPSPPLRRCGSNDGGPPLWLHPPSAASRPALSHTSSLSAPFALRLA